MGTPEFSVPSLETLLGAGYTVPAVVTAADKPRGRGQKLSPTAVKSFALSHGLRVLQPENLRKPTFAREVQSLHPDLIVVVAFRILPREIFTIPRLGSFNLHASLLPRYRGAAPINWAIMKGETETGVSTFFLEEVVDTGGVLLQRSVPIAPEDDAGTLHDRLATVGAAVVLETVRMIEEGRARPVPQNNALASPAPKLQKADCQIDWALPARDIHNRIRGLSPSPVAFTFHKGRIIRIYRSQVLDALSSGDHGSVEVSVHSLWVHTGDRLLSILELQQEGKRRMRIDEFLRGYRVATGERFSSS